MSSLVATVREPNLLLNSNASKTKPKSWRRVWVMGEVSVRTGVVLTATSE